MSRVRRLPLAVALLVGALLALPTVQAVAQDGTSLLSPQLDGSPRTTPRFQRPGAAARDARLTTQSFQPGSGVGNTGFDASGSSKRKAKGNTRPGDKSKTTGPTPLPPLPSRFGSPSTNPLAPTGLAVARPLTGVARRGASPYYVAPDTADPVRRRPPPDLTPFDPTGIQVGAFNFRPAIEVGGGYDTNPARTNSNPTPSLYTVVSPELLFNSNWARHSFSGEFRGAYVSYNSLPSLNRPASDNKLLGRIDVTSDTRIDLETRLLIGTDSPGSPNIQAGLAKLPIYTTLGAGVGLGQRFNRFDIALKGGYERTDYQNSVFTDGSTASNADRDYNRYVSQLRGSYDLTPGVRPFVEVGGDRRIYDLEVDAYGEERSSIGGYIKGGSTFEFSRILTGDFAVGWLKRRYQDPTLPEISGLTLDGSLIWVASALTTAKFTALTRVDESRVVGVSGVFTHELALQVDHAFRRWLLATGRLLYGNDNYVGSTRDDNRWSASAALSYRLTRELWLKSEYRHDWMRSTAPGVNYTANVILFGVRAQR